MASDCAPLRQRGPRTGRPWHGAGPAPGRRAVGVSGGGPGDLFLVGDLVGPGSHARFPPGGCPGPGAPGGRWRRGRDGRHSNAAPLVRPSAPRTPTDSRHPPSRWLYAARATTTVRNPKDRVTGAVPAKALRPLAVAERCGASPNSPSTLAPSTTPSPGWLRRVAASGCAARHCGPLYRVKPLVGRR
jgi:hypothetical protein